MTPEEAKAAMLKKLKENVKSQIAAMMESSELSQGKFASDLGKAPSEISRFKTDNRNYTLKTLVDIGYFTKHDVVVNFIPLIPANTILAV